MCIRDRIRLLKLSDKLLANALEHNLCERQIRALIRLPEEQREKAEEYIYKYGLNVSETEKYIDKLLAKKKKADKPKWTFTCLLYTSGKIKSGPEIYTKGAAGWFRGGNRYGNEKIIERERKVTKTIQTA